MYVLQRLTLSEALDGKKGSFINIETGEKEDIKNLWDSSSWAKLEQKRGKVMDKALSFIGSRSNPTTESSGAIVIVDPFSTGAHLASAVCKAGLKCAR